MRAKFPDERIVQLAEELATNADSEQVRLSALLLIVERCHGKVTDRHEVIATTHQSDTDDELDHLTIEQLEALAELDRKRTEILMLSSGES